jgi:hypothetical protein
MRSAMTLLVVAVALSLRTGAAMRGAATRRSPAIVGQVVKCLKHVNFSLLTRFQVFDRSEDLANLVSRVPALALVCPRSAILVVHSVAHVITVDADQCCLQHNVWTSEGTHSITVRAHSTRSSHTHTLPTATQPAGWCVVRQCRIPGPRCRGFTGERRAGPSSRSCSWQAGSVTACPR